MRATCASQTASSLTDKSLETDRSVRWVLGFVVHSHGGRGGGGVSLLEFETKICGKGCFDNPSLMNGTVH
jgi:hypothetical protein